MTTITLLLFRKNKGLLNNDKKKEKKKIPSSHRYFMRKLGEKKELFCYRWIAMFMSYCPANKKNQHKFLLNKTIV